MNKVIAQQMASIFFPVANTEKPKVGLWSESHQMQTITETLCCRSQFKLL